MAPSNVKLHTCLICGSSHKYLGNHLKRYHGISLTDYYVKYKLEGSHPICSNEGCSNPTKITKISWGFDKFCSRKCKGSHDKKKLWDDPENRYNHTLTYYKNRVSTMSLYLVSIDDEYLKFGITSQKIGMRLMHIRSQLLNHDVKLIKKIDGSPELICGLERDLYLLTPEVNHPLRMDGKSEVREMTSLHIITDYLENKLETLNEYS